jgi:hypothetical protein
VEAILYTFQYPEVEGDDSGETAKK